MSATFGTVRTYSKYGPYEEGDAPKPAKPLPAAPPSPPATEGDQLAVQPAPPAESDNAPATGSREGPEEGPAPEDGQAAPQATASPDGATAPAENAPKKEAGVPSEKSQSVLHFGVAWSRMAGGDDDYPRLAFGADAVAAARWKNGEDGFTPFFAGIGGGIHGLKESGGRPRPDARLFSLGPVAGATIGKVDLYADLSYAQINRYAPSNLDADTEATSGAKAGLALQWGLLSLYGGLISPYGDDGFATDWEKLDKVLLIGLGI